MEVVPLRTRRTNSLLILFEPVPAASRAKAAAASSPAGGPEDVKDRQLALLKQELDDVRHRYVTVIEERQTSQEESQNSAEEALSTNEELQSLNAELEVAKAELQATNEELANLNQRLLSNNAALTAARDFALSVIDTVASPLLILDTDLRVQAANPAFYAAFQIPRREAEGQLLYSPFQRLLGDSGPSRHTGAHSAGSQGSPGLRDRAGFSGDRAQSSGGQRPATRRRSADPAGHR